MAVAVGHWVHLVAFYGLSRWRAGCLNISAFYDYDIFTLSQLSYPSYTLHSTVSGWSMLWEAIHSRDSPSLDRMYYCIWWRVYGVHRRFCSFLFTFFSIFIMPPFDDLLAFFTSSFLTLLLFFNLSNDWLRGLDWRMLRCHCWFAWCIPLVCCFLFSYHPRLPPARVSGVPQSSDEVRT